MSEQNCQDFRAESSSDIYPIENRYISFSSYIGQRDLDTRQFPPAILAPCSNQRCAPVFGSLCQALCQLLAFSPTSINTNIFCNRTLHHEAPPSNISVYNKDFMKKVLVINRNVVLLRHNKTHAYGDKRFAKTSDI